MIDDNQKIKLLGKNRWMAIALLAVLAAGALFTWWIVQRVNREMRNELLLQARLVAHSVDLDHVKALSGTEADLASHDYRRLKDQFAAIKQTNDKFRFIYLMGRKDDGTVFFFVDNESVGSPAESPAGQIYEEISADYLRAFETKQPCTSGPIPDRWGTWVSALVPLIDPQTGELIAMLGMDIDARTWKWDVAAGIALPLGMMLALLILLISWTSVARSEGRLRESELFQRTVAESLPDFVFVLDINGTIQRMNRIPPGYREEEVVGQKATKYLPTEYHDAFEKALGQAVGTGQLQTIETMVVFPDGDHFFLNRMNPMTFADDQISIVLISTDITERKQAEEELVKFKTISDQATYGVKIVDAEGNIVYCNECIAEMHGYSSKEELTGKKLSVLHNEEQIQRVNELIQGLGIDDAFTTEEVWHTRRDGSVFPTLMNATAIKNEDGKPLYISATAIDVSDLKRAQQKIELTNKNLEEAIGRANQLAMEAEFANKSKSDFLANMSHEIRTPMNGIIGMTGFLLDTELTPEQREYGEIVRSCGDSLLRIINDILDYSKIEADKLDLETIDFDLRALLEEMGDLQALRAQERGVEYNCLIGTEVPSLLKGDPGRLRQVLINLVGNGIKFTAEGEVVVRVSLEAEDDSGATLRFEVEDTGIGIAEDRKGMLFEAFTQADASTTRKFGGTGLGLTISMRLAEMMGGRIGVESEEGEGSRFWFTAVFGKQSVDKVHVAELDEDIRDKRILVVDDNATNRRVLNQMLSSWGCRHTEVPGGKSALEELRTAVKDGDPYKIAILDMQMPELDGEALGGRIKDDEALRDTILIMMTSGARRGDAARCADIGFSAYLTKPVKQSQVYDCLVTVLGRESNTAELERAPIVTRYSITESKKSNGRILLAEDNVVNQKVALKILGNLGYRADLAVNGKEALKALGLIPYDLVLMDIQMPEMDGLEATRIIRNKTSAVLNHDIHIIAMTAHALKEDCERCLRAGMNDFVSKPIQPEKFTAAVQRWVSSGKAAEVPGDKVKEKTQDRTVFDSAAFLNRLGGDKDLVKEILEIFRDDVPCQISALKSALEQGDADLIHRQAHTLKGASANISASALQDVAFQLETAGKDGNFTLAGSLLEKIESEFEVLVEAITSAGFSNNKG